MRRKLFPLTAAALLVLTTSVAPMKVAAQELGDNVVILGVVGIGANETAEMYLARPSQADPDVPPIVPGDTPIFTYVVTNVGVATCRQTIEGQGPTSTIFGLPIPATTVSQGFGFVTFDDGEPIALGECFNDSPTQRVVIQVRSNRGYKITENDSPLPTQVLGHTIYNSITGETVASLYRGQVIPKLEIEITASYP